MAWRYVPLHCIYALWIVDIYLVLPCPLSYAKKYNMPKSRILLTSPFSAKNPLCIIWQRYLCRRIEMTWVLGSNYIYLHCKLCVLGRSGRFINKTTWWWTWCTSSGTTGKKVLSYITTIAYHVIVSFSLQY